MRFVVVLAALGACFSPKYPEGLACGEGKEPCPPGQLCDRGVCVRTAGDLDAAPDVGSPDDRDGDRVPNELDNCPEVANPGQFDEDGDAVGNACDPCPIDAATDDLDQDGVAGRCDPAPDLPGDRIAVFEGFDETPAGWTMLQAWTFEEGAAVVSSGDQLAALIAPFDATVPSQARASFLVDPFAGSTATRMVGLAYVAQDASGVACALTASADGLRNVGLYDARSSMPIAEAPLAWEHGLQQELFMNQPAPGMFECAPPNGPVIAGGAPMTNGQRIAIGVSGGSARFQWLLLVERTP